MMLFTYIVLLLTFASILLLYLYFKYSFNYWKRKGVLYKQPTFPFGNVSGIFRGTIQTGKYFAQLYSEFDAPYFGFFAFNKPYLVIKDPELIKRILIKDFPSFPNRIFYCNEKIDPYIANSLLGIKSPQWKSLRTKLSPIFTAGKIKRMMYLIKQCGENFKDNVETILEKNTDAKEIALKYNTNVITTCAFGLLPNVSVTQTNRRHSWFSFNSHLNVLSYFFAPLLVKTFKFKFFDLTSAKFWRSVFLKAVYERESMKVKRNDLMDALIELKNKETNENEFQFYGDRLVAQGIIFFLAGQDTSSSVIAFTLHELCFNVDIQNRLRKEMNDVVETHGDLTYEAVLDMKYLHMVVSETSRKYPLTSFLHRECVKDYEIPETGLIIEQGTPIIIPQYGLHWDPKYFPNPEKYDPERFNDENRFKIASNVYLPFGDGPRSCIGERFGLISAKVGLIYVLRNFKVEICSETKEQLIFQPTTLLRAKGGIPVKFLKL